MSPRESAGGIVVGPDGKMALVEQHGNSWSLPKGGIEAGESELDAAKREIHEETGISQLSLVGELGSYERHSLGPDGVSEQKELGPRKRTFFLFTTSQQNFHDHDAMGEVTQVRWVTLDEALALLTHLKDREFLASVRQKVEDAIKSTDDSR